MVEEITMIHEYMIDRLQAKAAEDTKDIKRPVVESNFDRWSVADSFEAICFKLATMVASYDPLARKAILREGDDFRHHCVGWSDASLLDELPKQMDTVCRLASRKKAIPIKIN